MVDSESFAYSLFLVVGAFITGIHAWSLYGERTSRQEHSFSDLIGSTNIAALGGQSAFARGFLTYLLFNELVYLILATSSTILDYARKLDVPEKLAGAMPASENLTSPNVLLPIAAATFLTTAARTKPFSEIESLLRRASHFLAGIPGTTYRIANAIGRFDFGAAAQSQQVSRIEAFSTRRAAQARELALHHRMDELDADDLADVVLRVNLFWGWATGTHGERSWSRQSREMLQPQFNTLLLRFEAFDSRLKLLIDGTTGSGNTPRPGLREWDEQLATGQQLRSDCVALLTLLLINNPTFRPPEAEPVLARMVSDLGRGSERPEFNVIAAAIILGIAGCFIFSFVGYELADVLRQLQPGKGLNQWIRDALSGRDGAGPETSTIVWHAVSYILMLGGTSIIALSLRAARIGNGTWERWDHRSRSYPIIDYLRVTALSALCVIPVYLLLNYCRSVILPSWDGAFADNLASLWADFAPTIPGQFLDACLGAAAAWIICLITDEGSTLPRKVLARSLAFTCLLAMLIRLASSSLDDRLQAITVYRDGGAGAGASPWSLVEPTLVQLRELSIPAVMLLIFCGLYALLYRHMIPRKSPDDEDHMQSQVDPHV